MALTVFRILWLPVCSALASVVTQCACAEHNFLCTEALSSLLYMMEGQSDHVCNARSNLGVKYQDSVVTDSLLEEKNDTSEKITEGQTCCSQRWIVAYMGVFFCTVFYIFRVNISVAIVSMTGSPAINVIVHDVNEVNSTIPWTQHNVSRDVAIGTCERLSVRHPADRKQPAELDWDKATQSFVLSSFFYGFIVTQIPGGWIAARYGGKHVIGGAVGISSVLTLLFPICARTHVYLAKANRVITGLVLGVTAPAWFALVGVWALPTERSRFMGLFWLGMVLGTILGYTSTGYLCVVGFDNGWGSVFYIHGIIGIVFSVIWYCLVFDSPEVNPRISEREKTLLLTYLRRSVPWRHILTSLPVWTVFITNAADAWLTYLLLTCLPLFMNDVLNFDIQSNGIFSSLPFMSQAIGLSLVSVIADKVISRHLLSVTNARKLFQITGNVLAAGCLVISGYISCENRELVIFFLCLCTFSDSLGLAAGYTCNPVDISPRFASVIYGISNTIASIPGILTPIVVAEMTQNSTQEEWLHVFYLTAGIVGAATVVNGLGASSELAPWSGQEPIELVIEEGNKEVIVPTPHPELEKNSALSCNSSLISRTVTIPQ